MAAFMSKWVVKTPKKCPDEVLLAEVLEGYSGGARYRKQTTCEVCSKTTAFNPHLTHCHDCLAVLDHTLTITFTIDATPYIDHVLFIASKHALDAELRSLFATHHRRAPAKVILAHSRSLLWSTLWHYGSLTEIDHLTVKRRRTV
eukprot:TRINITY_DN34428_c0_g1_i1.p1 TRINITY_DN34428_c0_g1~~TRINITY_DN34428_c0_g1_i1.p1  ORF type:complete len:157 (+),score=47.95 TRINITY_DN34428_c0_g1_i1:39-473(+)